MLIDKTAPFYTEEELDKLKEFDEIMSKFLNSWQEFMDAPDGELDGIKEIWKAHYEETERARESYVEALSQAVNQRYTESFNGDIEAIYADLEETVNAITKEDYLRYQKRAAEVIKTTLANAEKVKFDVPKPVISGVALATRGYATCYFFIFCRIEAQITALTYYGDSLARAKQIVDNKTASFYKKPKKLTILEPMGIAAEQEQPAQDAKPKQQTLPSVPVKKGVDIDGTLLTMPTSPVMSLVYELLGSGGGLAQLPDRKKTYNRNIQIQIQANGDKRRISYKKDQSIVEVEIDDFRTIANRNPQAKKILTRILLRANEQAIRNGVLVRDRVTFSLRELVGEGQYKNIETARQGFYNVTGILTGLKVSGKVVKGKKKTLQQGTHAVLFKGAKVEDATCEVYLNDLINWGIIVPYYTGLPDYYFELPDRAADLLEYIFYIARQNTKQIAERGYFTIGYRAIWYRLNLPDDKTAKNPKRDIKDAIDNAIEQIEEKYCKYAPRIPADATGDAAIPDFSLLPVADPKAPVKRYLDEGYLKISLKGSYAQRFIEISKRAAAKVEAARKRTERITEKAVAMKLAAAPEKAEDQ